MTKIQVPAEKGRASVEALFAAAALSGGAQVPGGVWTQQERCTFSRGLRITRGLSKRRNNPYSINSPNATSELVGTDNPPTLTLFIYGLFANKPFFITQVCQPGRAMMARCKHFFFFWRDGRVTGEVSQPSAARGKKF